ncbi:MAG TPA: zinc-dependent alcohol dehydrogenase [Micromonosporaceae bacterium]|nr:zinc-dependent alcohol dehydrogenase [Micromonosporaceae bacterium]
MKAVTWHGVDDIRYGDVPDPRIEEPTDAVVRVTTSAICGTDLHFVRGTMPGLEPGVVLGHEAVGEVVEVGRGVRNFAPGDRVVIASTVACGYCSYCRAGYFAQCDNANPNGKRAGTAFFGGPKDAGGFNGMQAEYARVPYANVGLVGLPPDVTDEQAITLSDIWPTGWFGARLAEVGSGDTVAVFGCGPVGQFAILSAYLQGAGRVIAVDGVADRLELARGQHAEVVDFDAEDPVQAILDLTGGVGVDRVVDAVGVDAQPPGGDPGDAPTQAARWAVEAVAKAGTIGVIGVYPPTVESFPFGQAMNKNLTVKAGNCNHRRYIPDLLALVTNGTVDPAKLVSREEPLTDVLAAYREFGARRPGWLKVALGV